MRKMILCKSDVLLMDEDSDASTWIDVEVDMDAHYISLFVFICLYVCLCVRESEHRARFMPSRSSPFCTRFPLPPDLLFSLRHFTMALSRPLPPHRRRISLGTQRVTVSLIEDDACDCLRDKSDDQLRAITADDLVQVLRGQWNLKDKVSLLESTPCSLMVGFTDDRKD